MDSSRGRSRSPRQARDQGNVVFKVGKHAGKTFRDVKASDPSYVAWAIAQESPHCQIASFADFLSDRPSRFNVVNAPDETPMTAEVLAVHRRVLAAKLQLLATRKQLFRELLLEFHPDRSSEAKSTETLQYINEAKTWFLTDCK